MSRGLAEQFLRTNLKNDCVEWRIQPVVTTPRNGRLRTWHVEEHQNAAPERSCKAPDFPRRQIAIISASVTIRAEETQP
jgi:hypothetical protein